MPENVTSVAMTRFPVAVSNWGPNVVYLEDEHDCPDRGMRLHLVNLETGVDKVIAETSERIQAPAIGAFGVVWLEVRIKETQRERRCSMNPNDAFWTLYHYDPATGRTTQLDSGIGRRVIYGWAQRPILALDGEHVAYDVERTIPGTKRYAATIMVRSLQTGDLVASLDTDHPIASLALHGDRVAFVQGIPPYGPWWATFKHPQLVLETLGGETTVVPSGIGDQYLEIDPIYDVVLTDSHLVWFDSNGIVSAPLGDLSHTSHVGDDWYKPPIRAGDGLVYWPRFGVPIDGDPHDSSGYLDEASGEVGAMYLYEVGDEPSIGNGWLVWMGASVGEEQWHIAGMPVAELRRMFGWDSP